MIRSTPTPSARRSTTQANLTGGIPSEEGVFTYYAELMKQEILIALENNTLLGFVSFRINHTDDRVPHLLNLYISTLLVNPTARGPEIDTVYFYKKPLGQNP